MNNLDRLKKGIIDVYRVHGERNGYSPAAISHMINDIDFFALYQTLRICGDRKHVYRYFAYYNDYCGYQSDRLLPGDVVELYAITDYRSDEGDCEIHHKIELVVCEDMSLAILTCVETCCELESGKEDYSSEYREIREEWPLSVAAIDLDVLHRRLVSYCRGFDEDEYLYIEA